MDRYRKIGNEALLAGRLEVANQAYETGLAAANRRSNGYYASAFQSNLSTVSLARLNYQEALKGYLQARALAETTGSAVSQVGIDLNLANLYVVLGELDAANLAVDQGFLRKDASLARHQLLLLRAQIRAKQGKFQEARADFETAIQQAEAKANWIAVAGYSDALGDELLLHQDFQGAGERFERALSLRRDSGIPGLRLSLLRMSWLRLEEGKLTDAEAYLNAAERAPRNDLGQPPWFVLYLRARLLHQKGQNALALAEFRKGLRACREWQQEAAPAGTPGADAQRLLDGLYREVVDVSFQVDPSLAVDAFEATEEDRAASLRQMLTASDVFRRNAPPEYWAAVAKLRESQTREFSNTDPSAKHHVEESRLALREVEARFGRKENPSAAIFPENNTTGTTLRRIQEGLKSDEALLSFHAGREWSGLWAVTNTGIELLRLPSEKDLADDIRLFRRQVEKSLEGRDLHGSVLYRRLLGGLSQKVRDKPVWVVTADDSFFEVPFAALVADWKEGKPVYLLEQHTIFHTPSAMMLTASPEAAPTGPFLGVGDGIYNSADDRWKPERTGLRGTFAFWSRPTPTLQMVRLPGSGREIAACARAWSKVPTASQVSGPILLTGASATRDSLNREIARQPSVIHLASHFLTSQDVSGRALIDLGMNPRGEAEVLHERDIMAMSTPGALIAMSGCNSAGSSAVPTAGVLGLTRAWLIAGARVVVGSRWPTPDDTGVMFSSFYDRLGPRVSNPARLRASAQALRDSQLEMLRSNSWRSEPGYWSAFYVLGKE